jgi:hypothetical protein
MNPTFTFKSELWLWAAAKASWHFISLPQELSTEIKGFDKDTKRRGFGSIPITVTIGKTSWRTSIFPDKKRATYVLPIKKEVRKKEHLVVGDKVAVKIELQ